MSNQIHHLFILGAGRPHRGLKPSALIPTASGQVVLDWIIEAFKSVGAIELHFMGGYGVDKIATEFPNVDFIFNTNWSRTGSGGSMLQASFDAESTNYMCYSDTVVSPDAVKLLASSPGEIVIAVDTNWQDRYENRSQDDREIAEKVKIQNGEMVRVGRHVPIREADAEFTGLVKVQPKAVAAINDIRKSHSGDLDTLDVPSILAAIKDSGVKVQTVNIGSRWAELNNRMDLAKFVLRSKAESLETLSPLVKLSLIDPMIRFTFTEWELNSEKIIKKIFATFRSSALAVRSSASGEDSWTVSEAGKYYSALNVNGGDHIALTIAIGDVFDSYETLGPTDSLMVQAMVDNVSTHGVITSRTIQNGAPYYIINYDDNSEDTTTVTSGNATALKLAVAYRDSKDYLSQVPKAVAKIIPAIKELERLVGHDALDIEFAITKDGLVHILQIRPLTMIATHETDEWDRKVVTEIASIHQKFESLQKPAPFLFGSRSILGIMPDWNPAEIIGTRPRGLALSLYRFLVTDDIWSSQRREYGYRDVTPHPLLQVLGGHPYIDTRAMFNSFIPADIPDELATRLVDMYLDRLEQEPHLHDKVEFEIAITCLTFDFENRVKPLIDNGFSTNDIEVLREALHRITIGAASRRSVDHSRLLLLEKRYSQIMRADMAPLDRALMLLEDCKRLGTLPFAHMARTAFIAVAMLKSLESTGITIPQQTAAFMEQTPTVATQLELDADLVRSGELSWDKFIETYGHLRPGTYDVTNLRYADDQERYLKPLISIIPKKRPDIMSSSIWDENTRENISTAIKRLNIDWTVEGFEEFVRQSIQDREYAKFLFSKNISAALEEFVYFGKQRGITRDQISYINLKDIFSFRDSEVRVDEDWLISRIEKGRRSHERTLRIELPELIVDKSEIEVFVSLDEEPNFVTSKRVQGKLVILDTATTASEIQDCIVLIPHADPGYDWLLAMPIAGLITMYGGANSHMSIRAAEMSLPAAIGTGEKIYANLSNAVEITLDCESRRIEVIR